MAPRVEVKDPHASVWPLELGLRTPMLWCGPSSEGLPPLTGGILRLEAMTVLIKG